MYLIKNMNNFVYQEISSTRVTIWSLDLLQAMREWTLWEGKSRLWYAAFWVHCLDTVTSHTTLCTMCNCILFGEHSDHYFIQSPNVDSFRIDLSCMASVTLRIKYAVWILSCCSMIYIKAVHIHISQTSFYWAKQRYLFFRLLSYDLGNCLSRNYLRKYTEFRAYHLSGENLCQILSKWI